MGPATANEENPSSTSVRGINLPKLAEDGSNWVLYQERLENAITATKGLRRHLQGTARKPEPLETRDDQKVYAKGGTVALTNDQIDAYEEATDIFEQREAQVREFIYGTVDPSTFIQIKGSRAAEVWKKLKMIHATKGDMFQTDLLNKLQTIRYAEGDDMRTHLGTMKGLRERLAETGAAITDDSFNTHIRTSLSLTT
jgi:hypothetical protein